MFDGRKTKTSNPASTQGAGLPPRSATAATHRETITAFTTTITTLPALGNEDDLIDLIITTEQAKAALAALEARAAATLHATRAARHAAAGKEESYHGHGIGTELAFARHESPDEGRKNLKNFRALHHDLPRTMERFTHGKITEAQALTIAQMARKLGSTDRLELDRRLNEHPEQFTGEGSKALGDRVRKIVQTLDARDALAKAEAARTKRYVALYPAPNMMMKISGLIPVEHGLLINEILDDLATMMTTSGGAQGRNRAQIRTDEFVALLTGTGTTVARVEIGLVMTERTMFRGDTEPAHLTGYGTVPADWARALVHGTDESQSGAGDADQRWIRRLYTIPGTAELIGMDSKARLFPKNLARFITARDRRCRMPGCNAKIREIDHVFAWSLGGLTTEANGQGCCRACNQTKELPGFCTRPVPGARHTMEITTPSGKTYHSTAPPLPGADT